MEKINHWKLNQSGVVYDSEEVSVLGLVGKVTSKINEVVETVNQIEVNVDDNISNKIDEMKNDGTLRTYINDGIYQDVRLYPVLESEVGVLNVKFPYGDIRRYGAIENTDCTSAINNAITSYSDIFIPKGEWIITSSIFATSNKRIHGEGLDSVIKTENDIIMLKTLSTIRVDGIHLSDVTLWKHFQNSNIEHINMTNISHSLFTNVYVRKTGTNLSKSIGIRLGDGSEESYSYYNNFSKVKIDGFDTGLVIEGASNANTFTNVTIINCRLGRIIDNSNSNVFLGCSCEMCTEKGMIIQNKSFYNTFVGDRYETIPYSWEVVYSTTTTSHSNYFIGGLDYTTNGYINGSSNPVLDNKSKIVSITEWQNITKKTDVTIYKSTAWSVNANTEMTYVGDKVNTDSLVEYNKTTGIFTPKNDGLYNICANFNVSGKLKIYTGDTPIRTIPIGSSCSVSLTKDSQISFKIIPDSTGTIAYDFTNNRIDIARF